MPITIFRNDRGVLKQLNPSSLKNTHGLWNSLAVSDLDKDGDMDFVAGNLGLNSRYHCSKEKPFSVYAGDFDNNGSLDAIPAYYFGDVEYPVPPLSDLLRQIPMFKMRYQNFESYARTTMTELLSPVKGKINYVARSYEQRSVIIENLGNGQFQIKPLPEDAQRSPITDIAVEDIDGDGNIDLLMVGNDYSVEPVQGQHDGGTGKFSPVPPGESALWVEGDAKDIVTLTSSGNKIILVTQNKGPLLAFKKE
jgi:hypothetical protein